MSRSTKTNLQLAGAILEVVEAHATDKSHTGLLWKVEALLAEQRSGPAETPQPTEAQVSLKDYIYAERDKGRIVVMGLEGPMSMPLEEFVKQPADGMLYDLNRSEEVVMTFIHERKWVNDYAVALTIRKLVAQRDEARAVSEAGEGSGKVFVLIGGWSYEGYSEPDGIYSTKEKAEAAKKDAYDGYDSLDIMEYEIDNGKAMSDATDSTG